MKYYISIYVDSSLIDRHGLIHTWSEGSSSDGREYAIASFSLGNNKFL